MKRANPYPGLHRAPAKLADGTTKTYYYAWKSGPRIPHDFGTPEFAAAFLEAVSRKTPTKGQTLLAVLNAYQSSPSGDGTGKAFRDLAPRTRSDYIKHIRLIETDFGTMPIKGLGDQRARGVFLSWRDKLAEKSTRQADYVFATLSRILAWAYGRRMIPANPCERTGRLHHGSRAENVWSAVDETAFYQAAPTHLHLALTLALWTGQRQGDLLRLTWSAYDDETIRLAQGKTGAHVVISVGEPLRVALDGAERLSPVILTNSRGIPWTSHGFSSSWRKACLKAGIEGLTFHDLRGTAATRPRSAGCTSAEICAITGHSNADVTAILEKHYLASDPELGKAAIRQLEAGTKSPKRAPK